MTERRAEFAGFEKKHNSLVVGPIARPNFLRS